MENSEKISVIVPIYNVEKYLKKCVDSIIHQNYTNLEIILVDDGSTDNSGTIADEYITKDNRIKVFHKENGGLSDARNYGIDHATGKYITFVDSDDWIDLNIYKKCMEKNKNVDADIITFEIQIEYSNGKNKIHKLKKFEVLDKTRALIHLNTFKNIDVSACNKIYKLDLFKNIRFPKGKLCEDCYTMYKLFYNAKNIMIVPEVGYHYYKRVGSIANNSSLNLDYLYAFEEQMKFINKNFPEIKDVGELGYAFANLNIYNMSFLRNNDKNIQREVRNNARKHSKSVYNNKYLSIKKKIQFLIFDKLIIIYNILLRIK